MNGLLTRIVLLTACALGMATSARAQSVVYSAMPDLAAPFEFYGGQAGREVLDDLHATGSGTVVTVTFQYNDPDLGGAPFDAEVTVYDNPSGGDYDFVPIAGPYLVSGLARGRANAVVPIPPGDGVVIGADLWIGVRFTSATAGLVIAETATVGHSDDLYVEDGIFYWFGGRPKANFACEVAVAGGATAAGDGPVSAPLKALGAWPNPFNPRTTIGFELSVERTVSARVVDLRGRTVRSLLAGRALSAGRHELVWDGRDEAGSAVAGARYLVEITTMSSRVVIPVVLVE